MEALLGLMPDVHILTHLNYKTNKDVVFDWPFHINKKCIWFNEPFYLSHNNWIFFLQFQIFPWIKQSHAGCIRAFCFWWDQIRSSQNLKGEDSLSFCVVYCLGLLMTLFHIQFLLSILQFLRGDTGLYFTNASEEEVKKYVWKALLHFP